MVVTDDSWLDGPQLRAWLTMVALLETYPGSIDGQLRRDAGVNLFDYSILAMLSEQSDHTLVMTDLAQLAFGSLSRLSHAVTRLEGRGWVERRVGGGGRRHTTVVLTEAGAAAMTEAAPRHVAHVRRILVEPLTAQELATLETIGRKLVAAADPAVGQRLDGLIESIVARNPSARA